jgi:hypothetical protein
VHIPDVTPHHPAIDREILDQILDFEQRSAIDSDFR